MKCPNCNEENVSSARFCKSCGGKLFQAGNQVTQNESQSTPIEKNNSTKKQKKLIAIMSGIVLLIAVGSAIDSRLPRKNLPLATQVPITPIEEQQPVSVPAEAQHFVNDYSDRYSDPVSTYYAEMAYEAKNNGLGAVISDEILKSGKISTNSVIGETSEIGFTEYRLPIDAKMDQETSLDIFNDYTSKNLDRYMNMLSKNPSPEATAVLDSQFKNYCSDAMGDNLPQVGFLLDDAKIKTLMDTAKEVVAKYGSNADYSVAKAIAIMDDPENTSNTVFTNTVTNTETYKWHDKKIEALHEIGVRLVINVDVYNGKNITREIETINNVELSVMRQPDTFGGTPDAPDKFTYISIGQW